MIFLFPLSGICDRFLEVELASGLVLLKIWLSDSLADFYGEMLTFDEVPPNLPNCLAQNLHPRKVTYPLKNAGWKTIFLLKWSLFRFHLSCQRLEFHFRKSQLTGFPLASFSLQGFPLTFTSWSSGRIKKNITPTRWAPTI